MLEPIISRAKTYQASSARASLQLPALQGTIWDTAHNEPLHLPVAFGARR